MDSFFRLLRVYDYYERRIDPLSMGFDLMFMPAMPTLYVYHECASLSIVLEPRSTKTRPHELFSEALAVKTASSHVV